MMCNPANPKEGGLVNVWQETFPVRFGAIDRSDRMTLDAVFRFFQEAAISHAENLNVGRDEMIQTGQGWVLSRMSVRVDRRPDYYETVTVRTWPQGWEKLFVIRNYEILDKNNTAIIRASSAWLVVDIEKRRPLRPQAVLTNMPGNEELEALSYENGDAPLSSLAERDSLQKIIERKALYTDVDYNGHVNNARYIQWIEDTLDPKLLETAGKMRFDINYLNEILGNETVGIHCAQIEDNIFAFEGRKIEKELAAFRAELRLY
ncbi:MAG: thioesterase [Treponema sp.]|nr:thioesterase [Treponema sp.]